MFPRHTLVPEKIKRVEVQTNSIPPTLDVYLPSISDLTGGTNVSVDNVNFVGTNSSSIAYSSGFIPSSSVTLVRDFSFFCWLRPDNITDYAIFSIADNFGLVVDSGTLKVKRLLVTGQFELIPTGVTIPTLAWSLLRVYRKENNLYIKLGATTTVISISYLLYSGTFHFGKFGAATYTGNSFNIGLFSGFYDLFLESPENTFKFPFETEQTPSDNQICYLTSTDLTGNFTLPTKTATYDKKNNYWDIGTNSLVIQNPVPINENDITLSLVFSFPDVSSSSEVVSSWNTPFFSFFVKKLDTSLTFSYFSGSITNISLSTTLVANVKYHLKMQFLPGYLRLWLNGNPVFNGAISYIRFSSYRFWFNSNKAFLPTSNYKLFAFSVVEKATSLPDFYPDVVLAQKTNINLPFNPVKYRQDQRKYEFMGVVGKKDFNVVGSGTVNPNTTTTYTINQVESINRAITYSLFIELQSKTNWLETEVTIPTTVTVAANTTSITFNITTTNFSKRENRNSFKLIVVGENQRKELTISLNDTRLFSLAPITGMSGYVDGFLADSSTVSGTIPNLTATVNATTTATLYTTGLYGKSYLVDTTGKKINIPVTLTGVRTVFFLYRELSLVANRQYVGFSTGYTFNGGSTGQLVGSLIFTLGDYLKIATISGRVPLMAMSADESNFAYLDDLNNTVKVVRKVAGIWATSTPVTLPLVSGDAATLANASLQINSDGTTITIGLKNANAGEGRVLMFTRSGASTWTSTLTLGSPIPIPYLGGFGLGAITNDADTKLLASEQSSNKIYVFEKALGIYNTTPVQTINYAARKIVGSPTLSRFATIDGASNVRVFDFSVTYALTTTLVGDLDVALEGNYLALSKFNNSVEIWFYAGSWTLLKTISSVTSLFGYSLSFNANFDLMVGSPSENKAYFYLNSDNYTTPTILTGDTQFGYNVDITNNTHLVSDYTAEFELYSKDGSSFPQTIIAARQNGAVAPISDNLDTSDVSIAAFTSSVDLTIDSFATSVNGLFIGAVFFNRALTEPESQTIENTLKEHLNLKEQSLCTP